MVATSEFLASIPRRKDGKCDWPNDLKARVVVETNYDSYIMIKDGEYCYELEDVRCANRVRNSKYLQTISTDAEMRLCLRLSRRLLQS